ncbi:MAG: thrombospondin type 3 repeat-containing protein, partial [Verrucomicrobiales bacterium]
MSCLGAAQGQVIDQVIDPISLEISPDDEAPESGHPILTVEFEDLQKVNVRPIPADDQDLPPTIFVIQHSDNVSIWEEVEDSVIPKWPTLQSGRHVYQATAEDYDPGGPRKFYRILGYSSIPGIDSDADGLSDALEATLGTLIDESDTDGDGSSDLEEFAYGTDPRNPNEFPNQSPLPAIAFTESQSRINESAGTYTITVGVENPFSGDLTVRYSIDPLSSAKAPGDISSPASESPATETVQLTGGTATIEITLEDDLLVKPQRLLILDLEPDPSSTKTYRLGGRTTHIVILEDNDCYWSGLLKDDITERNFRLRMLRQGAFVQTDFVTGEASDGAFKLDLDWPQWGP